MIYQFVPVPLEDYDRMKMRSLRSHEQFLIRIEFLSAEGRLFERPLLQRLRLHLV